MNHMIWAAYLDVPGKLGGEALLLHVLHSSLAPEQINGHTRGEETLVLLPLQGLVEGGRAQVLIRFRSVSID